MIIFLWLNLESSLNILVSSLWLDKRCAHISSLALAFSQWRCLSQSRMLHFSGVLPSNFSCGRYLYSLSSRAPLLNPRPPKLFSASSFRTLIVLGSSSEVNFGEGYKDSLSPPLISGCLCLPFGVAVHHLEGLVWRFTRALYWFILGWSLLALDTSSQSLCVSQARCTVRF